ncbi:MAG: hypothetical protein Q9170_002021 [Blastenia crenularia]
MCIQPKTLPPYFSSDSHPFDPYANKLQRGELVFLVFLHKLHHQPFKFIAKALTRLRRECHQALVPGERKKVGCQAMLNWSPFTKRVENDYYCLQDSTTFKPDESPEGDATRKTTAIYAYWELCWKCDKTPGKKIFWGRWQEARNLYCHLSGTELYRQHLLLWLSQQPPVNPGPVSKGFLRWPHPPALITQWTYAAEIPTPAYPPARPVHLPSPPSYEASNGYCNFLMYEMDFMAAMYFQGNMHHEALAEIIRRMRWSSGRVHPFNPGFAAADVNSAAVKRALEGLPSDHVMVRKWNRIIRPGDPCVRQFVVFMSQIREIVGEYNREHGMRIQG